MAMTGDRGVFADTVRGITVQDRGGGSSVSTPLEMIRLVYGNTPHLQIVWITDGEFSDVTEQSSLLPLTGGLEKVSITMIGVGTRTG
jgi:hypothetical protein